MYSHTVKPMNIKVSQRDGENVKIINIITTCAESRGSDSHKHWYFVKVFYALDNI